MERNQNNSALTFSVKRTPNIFVVIFYIYFYAFKTV